MAASVSSFGDDDAVMSDINVTPLVDVVLVLLIVFMITVPAIVGTAPIKVDLPETTAAAAANAAEQLPLDIYVRREPSGQVGLYVGDRRVDLAGLKRMVESLGRAKADQEVKIAGDKGIPYGEVIKVMDTLASMGMRKLSLDTKPVGPR